MKTIDSITSVLTFVTFSFTINKSETTALNGINVFGSHLDISHIFSVITTIMCLSFCNISWADEEPVPVFEIKETMIARKETMKKEIIYSIKIYPDGKVHYHGNDKSAVLLGDKYAQLTKDQLDNLTTYFLSLPFEKSWAYQVKRWDEERFSGFINYKDHYMNIEINDLIFVIALEKKLNTFVNIKNWVCFVKTNPNYKNCLPDNFPENIESEY